MSETWGESSSCPDTDLQHWWQSGSLRLVEYLAAAPAEMKELRLELRENVVAHAGGISKKYADAIFLLCYLPFKVRNLGGGGVHQLLRLAHVQ